ncbi:MAG: hypothetical protein O2884_12480 [Chloroflexi bacterium]|nr:hypothetical protein [Chloroflexota bacterium]
MILPWILLAEHFPTRHFAKPGLIITIPSTILSSLLGPLAAGLTMDHWGLEGLAFVLMALSLTAAILAWRFPRPAPVPQPAD